MNGYNFTERVRKVLALSREVALGLDHEYVGTEHLLLGLIKEGEGVAAAVLTNLDVEFDDMRKNIDNIVRRGKSGQAPPVDLPYTSRAKKVLELAMAEARDLHHNYVGTEHLMLGLIREEKGIAAQVLTDAGVTLKSARDEVVRLVGSNHPGGQTTISRTESLSPRTDAIRGSIPAGVTVELRFENGATIYKSFSDVDKAIDFLKTHEKQFPKG